MDKRKRTKLTLQKKGKQSDAATLTSAICSIPDVLNETSEFQVPVSSVPLRQQNRKVKLVKKDNLPPKGSAVKEIEPRDDEASKSANDNKNGILNDKAGTSISIKNEGSTSSTEKTDEEGKCPLCSVTINKAQLHSHFQECLQEKFKHTSSLDFDANSKTSDKLSEECFFCQFCQKDLSKFNSTRKTQHLNNCMDKAQRESKEDTNSTNKKKPEILECPICGKKLKTVQARRVHMKKCAVTYNVSTEQVIKLAQKQEEEKNILAALNEPSESERQTETKVSKNQNRKKIKEPRGKFEEDMQIAMAISSSLADTGLEVIPQESGPSRKRGKKDKNKADPILLLLSDQQKQARTENSISSLLLSQENKDNSPMKERVHYLSKSKLAIQETKLSLWQKGSLQLDDSEENDTIRYYVGSLMPPLEPSTVVTGSKLRRMSQIPGRGRQSSVYTEQGRMLVDKKDDDRMTGNHGDDALIVSTQTVVDLAELMVDETSQGDQIQNNGDNIGGFCQQKIDQLQTLEATKATDLLKKHYACLLHNPEHSDVSIVTRDGSLQTHKVILYARCPVLYKMICGDRIPLENETSDAVKAVLTYIYTADFVIPQCLVHDVRALSIRLKLEELTEACDTLMLSGAEVQSDSDEEDEKLKEIMNVDNVFSDDSEKERTRAEKELITEADEISDDDYFDIMLTQREKLRKLSKQSDQGKDEKVSHDGVGRSVSRYNIGDATQREISLFFRNGLNSESSSDEDVSEAKRHKSDHPDVDGSQYLLKSSERREEENDNLHLCMNSLGSSSSQVLNIEKLKSDSEPCLSPNKKQRTRNTGINHKPCDLLTAQTSSVNMSSDIIEIGSSGDSNSLDGITIPAETEMNLSGNCQKNVSQQRKSIEGNMSFVEHTNYKSSTSKSRDLNSPDMEMDLSGADLFGSPSPAASSNRSSPEREDTELTPYKHLGDNSNLTPHEQRKKEIDLTPPKHLREDTVLTPRKLYTENSNIHVTPHKQFNDDTDITPHKQCRDSNPSSPDQVMEILSSPEHVNEVQDYPDCGPSTSLENEDVVSDRMSCSIDNRKYSGTCIFKRNVNMVNDDSNDEDYRDMETDRKNCDIDPCDNSVKPSDNISRVINEHVTNSPNKLIANTSPKFKPRQGKRFRFQRKVLIVPKDDDDEDDDDEAYCSQIVDKPFIQDSEKGQKVTSKGKGRASAGKLSMSPVYQPSTSREQEGEDGEGIHSTDLTMSPVYHQPNSSCQEESGDGVRTGPTEPGELSPLEEDVWEDFEDEGGIGDVVIMDSPERNAGSSIETPKYTVIRPEENINDVSDLPDIPEAHDVEEFSDSFVVPDNDNINMDKQGSSSDAKKDFKTPVSIGGGIHKGQRTQKDPSKVWMPPSPFTPMPDYDKMATPILKREVQRYGVKPIPKKKMIVVLKDIYQKMHEYETDSELEISKGSVGDDDNDVEKIDDKLTGDDSEDEDINCSQESSTSCTSDLIEESFMQTEETDLPASQQPKGDLKEKFREFIEKRNDIHDRILMYEPLELDWLKKELTDAGIKTSMDKLMNFLDEKCITFTMKNRRNNSPRKRRGRKKKEESTNK